MPLFFGYKNQSIANTVFEIARRILQDKLFEVNALRLRLGEFDKPVDFGVEVHFTTVTVITTGLRGNLAVIENQKLKTDSLFIVEESFQSAEDKYDIIVEAAEKRIKSDEETGGVVGICELYFLYRSEENGEILSQQAI